MVNKKSPLSGCFYKFLAVCYSDTQYLVNWFAGEDNLRRDLGHKQRSEFNLGDPAPELLPRLDL